MIRIAYKFTAIRDPGSEIKQGRYSAPAFVCRRFQNLMQWLNLTGILTV